MSKTAQATRNTITLKGSTKVVTEFFAYAVNSILYQRGIYSAESFEPQKQYGLTMMVTTDTGLTKYLTSVLQQMSDWLVTGALQKMVLVVTSVSTKEVLERWTFDIQTDKAVLSGEQPAPEKSESEITSEIQAIVRQITASVTFLPLLNDPCTFDLLVYTDTSSDVPFEWEESDARYITNAADVKLRSFTTKVHKVDALVSYKADAEG
ncbi:DNA-binding protein [Coccomyxa subellipsoidea C-169]|uniref:DNA-binding protein n=1 Tax=Coccomyxa subellipsoidea (strain C-169) TaxID=574566 RepID=I0Z6L2_COCSC|nr:DNA-binding protein [Coccomyxa subellipsoidea C-169]EIE26281.1 DNA-binding protein [Coccomyxa subellipsoidea C-169]|eukprot:XP_005650825.1 DNA-binding protein [Coccomyxa subellipsoidea C-169]